MHQEYLLITVIVAIVGKVPNRHSSDDVEF
jgi:hypothetical protein